MTKLRVCPKELLPQRERALSDYLFFRSEILGRKHLVGNKFQEDMCAFSSHYGKKRIKMKRVPRAHGKTTENVDQIMHLLTNDPNERILFSGPNEAHANAVLGEVKEIAEKCSKLHVLFPEIWDPKPWDVNPLWLKDRIQLRRSERNKNPSVLAVGLESTNTGSHWTRIFVDDNINEDNYRSKVMRDMVWDRVLSYRALLDDTPDRRAYIIYSNTPWHDSDATVRMTRDDCPFRDDVDLFERTVYVGGGTEPQEDLPYEQQVIWPEVRSHEFIASQRLTGMRFFSPHYLMKPMAEGQHPFDVTKLRRFDLRYTIDTNGIASWQHPEGLDAFIHMAVDTNTNANTASDPVAIHIWAKDSMRHMWGLYKRRVVGCTTPQLHELVHDAFMLWRPHSIQFEVHGKDDRSYYELMQYGHRRGVSYPVNRLPRGGGRGKGSKYSRIVPMSAAVHEGWFHVPLDPAWAQFIEEMELFDENCEHDDQMDCVADIYTHGRWPSPPEKEEEDQNISANLLRVFMKDIPKPRDERDDRKMMVASGSQLYV